MVVDDDRQRYHRDLVALPQVARQLRVGIGDEPDHATSLAGVRAAARNLYRIIVEPISANRSSPIEGSGPHRFGRSAAHQIADDAIQMRHATWVPMSARRDLSALAPATTMSIGKYAGNTARQAPADVATPFPPPKPLHT